MNLSCFIVEWRELSGLNVDDFCGELGVDVADFEGWVSSDKESSPNLKVLLKALAIMVKSRRNMKNVDRVENAVSSASSLIKVLQESSELNEDHKQTLTVVDGLLKQSNVNK